MEPLKMVETSPGSFSLIMPTGGLPVDPVVEELGHEPNGYFWEGIAQWVVSTRLPALEGKFDYDPEAGMFCAFGSDRAALEQLGTALAEPATRSEAVRELVTAAEAAGFEFDD